MAINGPKGRFKIKGKDMVKCSKMTGICKPIKDKKRKKIKSRGRFKIPKSKIPPTKIPPPPTTKKEPQKIYYYKGTRFL